jgi:hypothetical protein
LATIGKKLAWAAAGCTSAVDWANPIVLVAQAQVSMNNKLKPMVMYVRVVVFIWALLLAQIADAANLHLRVK